MLVRVQICREPDTVLALKYSLISLLAPLIYFSRTSAGSDSVHTHYKVRFTDNTYVSLFFPTGTGLERLRAVRNCRSLCASALVSWDLGGSHSKRVWGSRLLLQVSDVTVFMLIEHTFLCTAVGADTCRTSPQTWHSRKAGGSGCPPGRVRPL